MEWWHSRSTPRLLVSQVLTAAGYRAGALMTAGTLALVVAGCSLNEFVTTCPSSSPGVRVPVECADPGGVDREAVLFLVGDAGYVPFAQNPVLQDMRARVNALSDRGVSVMVLYLGDNVYEEGVRADHLEEDLELLHAQVSVVEENVARARFVPGNHDWANTNNAVGRSRLKAQESALRDDSVALRAMGGDTFPMVPEAGCPGPRRVDIRNRAGAPLARVLAVDSQWWIADAAANPECASQSKEDVVRRLRSELAAAGDTQIVLAAHHPLVSGGPHGGNGEMLSGLTYRARLSNQDMSSAAYREYLSAMDSLVASIRVPVIFAAGHDHSLQVHELSGSRGGGPGRARWHHLVSGSASKRTAVRGIEREGVETLFAASLPGYMRLDFRSGGRIQLSVVAGCSDTGADTVAICETDQEFRTIFSKSIR
jgi:hypothetical protein